MQQYKNLSRGECRILTAVATTLMPRGGAFEIGAEDIDYLSFVDRYIDEQDRVTRFGLKYLIHQWNILPLLYFKHPRRFCSLTAEQKTRFLRQVSENPKFLVRSNALLFKMILGMVLYEDPRVEKELGYDRHCVEEPAKPAETEETANGEVG